MLTGRGRSGLSSSSSSSSSCGAALGSDALLTNVLCAPSHPLKLSPPNARLANEVDGGWSSGEKTRFDSLTVGEEGLKGTCTEGCGTYWRCGSRADDGGGGDSGAEWSANSAGTADGGVSGEEGCTVGEFSSGNVVEWRVREGAARGSASETGSLGNVGWTGDSGVTADGLFSALCLDLEKPGDVTSFTGESGLSLAGRFAASKGSVGTLNE